jgi:hypothetical protein
MAAGLLGASLVLVAGCSSGAGAGSSSASSETGMSSRSMAGGSVDAETPGKAAPAPGAHRAPIQTRKVISTGRVTLVSRHLGHVRAQIDALLARYGGYVAEEQTTTSRSGRLRTSSLRLRVPATDFGTVISAFKQLGHAPLVDTKTEDVTTQVIDVNARVQTTRDSIRTLRGFLRHTTHVDALIQIESDISEREADLESLLAQQRYLDNQTALATIDVLLRAPAHHAPPPNQHDTGFLAGLAGGWHALAAVAAGAFTVVGAVLPFAVLLVLLGVPAWLLVRRLLRRRTETPAPTEP